MRRASLAGMLLAAAMLAAGAEDAAIPVDVDARAEAERCVADYARDASISDGDAIAVRAVVLAALSSGTADGSKAAPGRRGLAVGALARCHAMHGTPGAGAASTRLLGELRAQWDPTRGLLDAPGGEPATSGDCAQVVHGAITCYSAIGEVSALAFAVELQDHLDHGAWREGTSLYGEGEGAAAVTALAALDLVRLARITDDDAFAARAARIIDAHGPRSDSPIAELSAAITEKEAPILHLTLIGAADEAGTAALLAGAHRRIVPGFAITVLDEGEASKALRRRFPGMPLMPRLPGKVPSAYLCTESACDPPTAEPAALARRIAELAGR